MCPFCRRDPEPISCSAWVFLRDIFYALATTCLLYALNRVASALLLGSRISALRETGAAYTPEEREVLIHKIKRSSLRY